MIKPWNKKFILVDRLAKITRISSLGILIFLAILSSSNAWATQIHDRPEGLFAHQMAHVFFLVSMVIFVYWLRRNQFVKEKAWRYIQYSAVLFILWNLDAMFVHWIEDGLDKSVYTGSQVDWSRQLITGGHFKLFVFYICKMDHLLCVPAILFLYFGVRELQQKSTFIEKIQPE